MMNKSIFKIFGVLIFGLAITSVARAQATRTWVSGGRRCQSMQPHRAL